MNKSRLLNNDSITESEDNSASFSQRIDNTIVHYKIENLYSDIRQKKLKSKYGLIFSPPILTIENSNGDKAEFQLTKELVSSLLSQLVFIENAYYGYDNRKKRDWIFTLKNFPKDFRKNPIVYFLIGIFLALLIKYYFFGG